MKLRDRIIMGILAACVAVAVGCGVSPERRQQLLDLQAQNQADTIFRNDSLQRILVRYFDRHGSSNERMLAHYLLGRALADMGEAPQAIEAYQQAIDCADTTSNDCDYNILNRVYGQMSVLYYEQGLFKSSVGAANLSAYYAWIANDTIGALLALEYSTVPLSHDNYVDSATTIAKRVADQFEELGMRKKAVIMRSQLISYYIDKGNGDAARQYIHDYEHESGWFDKTGKIAVGHEVYYYIKGRYYLAVHQPDSALQCFRMLKNYPSTPNNRLAYSHGLAKAFQQLLLPDSAAQYALQAFELNDSSNQAKVAKEVEKVQSLYRFNRIQKDLEQTHLDLQRVIFSVALLVAIIIFLIIIFITVLKARHEKHREALNHIRENLLQAQQDMRLLEDDRFNLEKMISEKQQLISSLQEELTMYDSVNNFKSYAKKDMMLRDSDEVKELCKIARKAQLPTPENWKQLYLLFNETIPNFYKTLYEKEYHPKENEYQMCILLRLRFSLKDIANLVGTTQQNIYNLRCRLFDKIINKEITKGQSKVEIFDNWIQSIY